MTTLDREVTRRPKDIPTSTTSRRKTTGKKAAGIAWLVTKWISRNAWRHRVALAPIYATTAMWIIATIEHSIAITRYGQSIAGTITIAAALTAALGIGYWRGLPLPSKLETAEPRDRGITIGAWSALAGVTVLAVITANIGTGIPLPGIWVITAIVVTAAWWTVMATAPADTVAMTSERARDTWRRRVASPKGPIPGSTLGGVTKVDGKTLTPEGHLGPVVARMGWTAVAELETVGTAAESVLTASNAAKVAAAYRTASLNVILSRDDDQSEHRIRVTVMTKNATSDINTYDPATWQVSADGCVPAAVCSDGTVPQVRVWQPGSGPQHGLVSGDSGSGKSKAVGVILTQACATGRVVPILADPQGGASLPAWAGRKSGVAPVIARDADEISELFAALAKLATHRETLISNLGVGDWDVETMWNEHGEPMYLVVLDEAHVVLKDPEMVAYVANAVKVWRKLGIGLMLISQTPNLTELGGDPSLRQNLMGYVIALRNSARVAGGMILPASAPDPYNIPRIIGRQTTQGMCSISTSAPFGSPTGYARFPLLNGTLAESEATRLAQHVIPDPDPTAAQILGIDVSAWRKRVDAIAAGDAETDKASSPLVEQGRATKKSQILAYLRAKEGRCVAPADIIAELNIKSSTVSMSLARLEKDGLVNNFDGLWQATTTEQE